MPNFEGWKDGRIFSPVPPAANHTRLETPGHTQSLHVDRVGSSVSNHNALSEALRGLTCGGAEVRLRYIRVFCSIVLL